MQQPLMSALLFKKIFYYMFIFGLQFAAFKSSEHIYPEELQTSHLHLHLSLGLSVSPFNVTV